MIQEIDLNFQDASRNETVATSHLFTKRVNDVEDYVTYFDSANDLLNPAMPPVYIRVKQERPKATAQSFGTRRTTATLTHGYIIPTPKATDLGGITYKTHVSASFGVTETQLTASIARFRAFVNSDEFAAMVASQDQ